jgi:hypothetical protein
MGALFSSLRSRLSLWSRWSAPLRPGASSHHERLADSEHLPDIEEGEGEIKAPHPDPPPSPPPKKRALLVGITYHGSTSLTWTPLDGPHVDVMHFQKLLIRAYFISSERPFLLWPLILITDTYGYSPEDIVILKDDPTLPEHLQPTRANMVRPPIVPGCFSVSADPCCTTDP